MEKQHTHLRANGFKVVQTKTKNKWRSMLILNIKSGFNIRHLHRWWRRIKNHFGKAVNGL